MSDPVRSVPAQQAEQAAALEGLLWVGAIVMACLAAVVLLLHLRRRMNSSHRDSQADFSLHELRRMRDRGSLSATEYEAVKQKYLHRSGKFSG
ncbi:MAG: hypothetical protein ACYTFA_09865 [Planctomycetota bacterium]|jgi:hypothetical protein